MLLIKEYPEFKLFKHSKGIYVIEATNRWILGSHFLRLEEFFENPKFKSKNFTILEFIDDYCKNQGKGNFNYATFYYAFNVPSHVFKKVYSRQFDFNRWDEIMLDVYNIIRKECKKFCLVGYIKGKKTDLFHEISHCLFYLNKQYEKEMLELLDNVLPIEERIRLNNELKKLYYHKNSYNDELIAYLSSGTLYGWKVNKEYIKPFKKKFEQYYNNLNAKS